MPTPNDAAIQQTQLAGLQALMAQSGRESTMLTPQGQNQKMGA
jgi:hypothetical protein